MGARPLPGDVSGVGAPKASKLAETASDTTSLETSRLPDPPTSRPHDSLPRWLQDYSHQEPALSARRAAQRDDPSRHPPRGSTPTPRRSRPASPWAHSAEGQSHDSIRIAGSDGRIGLLILSGNRLFGFLVGATLAGSGSYYYVLQDYKASNELLQDDIYVRCWGQCNPPSHALWLLHGAQYAQSPVRIIPVPWLAHPRGPGLEHDR